MLKFVVLFAVLCCVSASFFVGGYSDVDVNDEDVVAATKVATQSLGKMFSTPYHSKLAKITRARQQVVAGMNYKLNVIVGLTECRKDEVDFEEIEGCAFREGVSTYRKCEVVIYRNLQGVHKMTSSGCILATRDEAEA